MDEIILLQTMGYELILQTKDFRNIWQDDNGHLIIVTGITSEGWNNTEGQCLAYIASQPVWDLLDCGDQNNMLIHLDGHAILRPDMETILDYCDVHLSGIPPEGARGGPARMKGNLFLQNNRALLDPLFEPYLP